MNINITLNSLDELRELTERILIGGSGDNLKPVAAPKRTQTVKAAPAPEPVKTEEPARTAEEIINAAEVKEEANETDVKVMLADKIKGGKKAEVKALFDEYGVTKLSELIAKHPDELAEFTKKAEAL